MFQNQPLFLLPLRLILALSPGLLHPDETFQALEPFSHVLVPWRISATIPWEFNCETPLRSLISPALLLGPPFAFLRIVSELLNLHSPHPSVVLATCQLYIAGVTLLIEQLFLINVESFLGVEIASLTRMLLSLSWPMGILMSRPFSNTVEAWALSLLICSVFRFDQFVSDRKQFRAAGEVAWIALIFSVGIFARFTFLFYAFPCCLWLLYVIFRETQEQGLKRTLTFLGPVLLVGAVSLSISFSTIVVLDTSYYGGPVTSSSSFLNFLGNLWNTAKLAPVNAFLYNSQASNLAIHGTHPRWLHSLVNMNILFGPLWMIVVAFSLYKAYFLVFLQHSSPIKSSPLVLLCSLTVISGLFFLSLAPHQEPRFLLPLSFPLSVCGAFILTQLAPLPSSSSPSTTISTLHPSSQSFHKHYSIKPAFLTIYSLFNVFCVLFFGFFHQGGIKPMTSIISNSISSSNLLLSHPPKRFLSTSTSAFTWPGLLSFATVNSTLLLQEIGLKKTRTIVFYSTYPPSQAILFQEERNLSPLVTSGFPFFPKAPWCETLRTSSSSSSSSRPQVQSINVGSSTVSALDRVLNEQFLLGPANAIVVAPRHLSRRIEVAAFSACTGLGYESGVVGDLLVSTWPHTSMEDLPTWPLSLQSFSLDARLVECIN